MPLPTDLIKRMRQEIEENREILEQLKSGALMLRERRDRGDWVDANADAIAKCERLVKTYQEILGRAFETRGKE